MSDMCTHNHMNSYSTFSDNDFNKMLKDKNINLTAEEIADDCQGILNMLNSDE